MPDSQVAPATFRPRSHRSPGNHQRCPGPPRTSPGSLPRKTAPRGPCTSGRRRRASCNSTWGCLTLQQCKNASLHKNILQVPHLLPRAAASPWAASAAARAVSPQVQEAHVLIFLEKVLGADATLANFAGDLAGIAAAISTALCTTKAQAADSAAEPQQMHADCLGYP